MSSRLCSRCEGILVGPQTLRQENPHHTSASDLIRAANDGCYICGIIAGSNAFESLDPSVIFRATWYLTPMSGRQTGWFRLTIDAALSEEEIEMMDEEPSDGSQSDSVENIEDDFGMPEVPMWGFCLQPAVDVENSFAQSEPPSSLDDPELLDLAQSWLSDCSSGHRCGERQRDFRPTRLIEILSSDHARVVIAHQEPSIDLYATLSHCWGKSKRLKLEATNLDKLRANINIGELPNTYREAIAICIGLRLRYIWIDSLCIMQDSRDDWQREALTMKDVYQNSVLNIAAAASAESTQPSFLRRDVQKIRPLEVSTRWTSQETRKYYLINAAMYDDEVERAPLRQRAWVVQEIWLAPRNLFLTKKQLWWECCEREACESYPRGVPEALLSADWLEKQDKSFTNKETRWGKLSYVYNRWDSLVETYTSCKLTFPSDRIIAFAGILQHFQEVIPNDDCLAGHWRSKLPQSLSWVSVRGRWSYRPAASRAPSWSWTSIEGPVAFNHTPELAQNGVVKVVCNMRDIQMVRVGPADGSDLKSGWLKLSGHLTRVGCIEGHLTVEKNDGSFDFIQGSTDDSTGSLKKDNWTAVEFDENTKSGDIAMSYLDGLTSDALLSGDFSTCQRTVISWDALEKEMYSFPIIKWEQDKTSWSRGLILCETVVESQRVFQRIGSFTISGLVPAFKVLDSPQQEFILI